MAPTEPREQTADQQIEHALSRLGFGARPGDFARLRAVGVDQWIALQLAPDRIDDRSADAALPSYEGRRLPTAELVAGYVQGQQALRRVQREVGQDGDSSSRRARRADALHDDPQLRERLQQRQRAMGDVQSGRTDHGHASALFVVGGAVKGKRVDGK